MVIDDKLRESVLYSLYENDFTVEELGKVSAALFRFTEDSIVITKKEYKELQERDKWLSCLEGAGVDNWEGYDMAIDMREQAYGGR